MDRNIDKLKYNISTRLNDNKSTASKSRDKIFYLFPKWNHNKIFNENIKLD